MDMIVINGEGFFHGDSTHVLNLLFLAYASKKHLGKIVHIINHSCYPQDSLEMSLSPIWEIYKKVYSAMDFIAIREPASCALMRRAGVPAILSFDCLPLFITGKYEYISHKKSDTIIIAGSVAWQDVSLPVVSSYIDHLKRLGFHVQVLTGSSMLRASDDDTFVKDLLQHCSGDWEIIEVDSINKWLDTIAQASLLVSGRFHHTIAAAVLDTPFILLESNTPKNAGLAQCLGVSAPLSYDSPDLFTQLLDRTHSILDREPLKQRHEHYEMVKHLCDLAMNNFTGL
jgi:polysaccharide pyruvyl transferase WcaK-like protein